MNKPILFIVALFVAVTFCGCVPDQDILAQVNQYFPGSTLLKFDKRVLWIQTKVDGVGPKFTEMALNNFLAQADTLAEQKSLGLVHFTDAFAHDGYIYLVIGFQHGIIIWDRRVVVENGVPSTLHWVMAFDQAPAWFTEHIGYYPRREQITIVKQ
jgi:hypothetical protein